MLRQGTRTWVFALVALCLASWARAKPESGDGVVRFRYSDAEAEEVYLVGDFNGWSPNATPLDPESDGEWVTLVFLDPGTYEYKFLVDGEWRVDADNPELSANGNSVVRVGAGGVVLPPGLSLGPSGGSGGDAAERGDLRWFVRYLGFFTSRRDRELDRYDLDRPEHDVDVRLEADFGDDLSGWFLMNFNNLDEGTSVSRTRLRYDRGAVLWRAPAFELELFDNTGVVDFEDPGHLVGKVGIYEDAFGFRRRGVHVERRILGAPLQFLYADNTEDAFDPTPVFPGLIPRPPLYDAVDSKRNADILALRFRAGRADEGLGFGWRWDRGAAPGTLEEVVDPADTTSIFVRTREYATHEEWSGWSLDLRLRPFGTQLIAEYMAGARHARAQSVRNPVSGGLGAPVSSDTRFELDDSKRAIVLLRRESQQTRWVPELRYDYHEHDFTQLVTGEPFLMRRNGVTLTARGRVRGIEATFAVEQSWFDYPAGATWETQFWFRRHNFWLDEDTARFDRLTLLGADRASRFRTTLSRSLWAERDLTGSVRFTWSSPGFDRAPRYLETVLRFGVDVGAGFELRTHSRLATYRRFTTADPEVVAALGPGPHLEAGSLVARDLDATHDMRTFHAHFVELVYPLSDRSDIALGFGVDPFVVYEVRNQYMDIGWDEFLFDAGASPRDAFFDPAGLGQRLEAAERALERERRLMLEARVRF